ncbi:MAG: hypothetical protein K6E98_12845 [Lachnospiraceae bacterium]|nr:hypothetical protein [Lachnospiraceae bacterium]
MVLGTNVSVFAADTPTSVSSNGVGTFEGHVSRNVVDITLPTVTVGTSPFSFILDSEGLIEETSAAAYGSDFTFNDDKYVYFKTADKTYGASSSEFTVSNNSSVSCNITLKVDVARGTNDPTLVGSTDDLPEDYSDSQASGDPSLYLGLVVTGDALSNGAAAGTYAISENSVSKTFCVAGEPDNYTVSANGAHDYQFKKLANPAKAWKQIKFNLTGAANKVDDAKGITAPNLTVTWSFAAVEEEAEEAEEEEEEEEVVTTPTDAYGQFSSDNSKVWLALSDQGGIADSAKLTSVKLGDSDVEYTVEDGWILVTWQQMKAAGATWDATGTYSFTFVYDGTTYTADVNPR